MLAPRPRLAVGCSQNFQTPELSNMGKGSSGNYRDQRPSVVKVEISMQQPEQMTIPVK